MPQRPLLITAFALMVSHGFCQVLLVDQTAGQQGASIVAQDFESAYETYSSFASEDVIVPSGSNWVLDSVLLMGEYQTPSGTPSPGAGIIISIHADNGGLPGTIVFTDTLAANADPDQDGSLKYVWQDGLDLTQGTYWIVAAARKDYASTQTQWQWFSANSTQGDTALWINPGGGFTLNNCPNWTEVTTCYGSTYPGLSFQLYGCPGAKPELLNLPSDTSFCSNQSLTLIVNSTASSAHFAWSNGDFGDSTTISEGGVYSITLTDTALGCYVVDSVAVSKLDAPEPNVSDTFFCEGTVIHVSAGTCPQCAYMWSGGETTDSIQITEPGTYWVNATDTANGCTASDTFQVESLEVAPIEFETPPPYGVCPMDSLELTIANDYASILWSTGSTTKTEQITASGGIHITVVADNGCTRTDSILILDFPAPQPVIQTGFNAGMYVLDCPGFESYAWSNGSSGESIQVSGGTHSVTVTDSNGCVGSDTVNLALGTAEPLGQQISVRPNPTSDVLYISNLPQQEPAALRVFTSGGVEVHRLSADGPAARIDLSGLPNGHYFLQVKNDQSTRVVGFIKLK